MWVWFFGLSISIFLIFRELEFSAGVSLIPLIVLSFFACLEFIFRIFKFPKCSQWREWINTGFLADLSVALVVLVALEVYGVVTFSTFFILLTCAITFLSFIYVILKGEYTVLSNSPMHLRVANIISYICTIMTYLFFYGVEHDSLEHWIPLVPFVLSVVAEIYITVTLYNGIDGIQSEFTLKTAQTRMIYMTCIFILLLTCIIHYLALTPDIFLYVAATVVYFIGIIVMTFRSRKRLCKNLDCLENPKYNKLRNQDNEDVDPEEGVGAGINTTK